MIRVFRLALLSLSLGLTGLLSASAAVLYSTQFDKITTATYELAGQKGWIKDTASGGGNGLITNFNGSQAAYVGLFDLRPADDFISLWRPINHTPVIKPGTRGQVLRRMSRSWIPQPPTGTIFFGAYITCMRIAFSRSISITKTSGIYYILDGTNEWVYSGAAFENDVTYKLQLTMNFARNRWSAALDGTNILKDLPITTMNAPLTLGDIDAVWAVFDRDKPGDNFMVFDNYQVVTEPLVARPTRSGPGPGHQRRFSPPDIWTVRFQLCGGDQHQLRELDAA